MYAWLTCTCIMVNILMSNVEYNKHMSIKIKQNSLFNTGKILLYCDTALNSTTSTCIGISD